MICFLGLQVNNNPLKFMGIKRPGSQIAAMASITQPHANYAYNKHPSIKVSLMNMQAEMNTIQKWLDEMQHSVKEQDLDRHMALVSKRVQIYGLPRKDTLDYQQWYERRQNEFQTSRLIGLQHGTIRIKTIGLLRIAFNVDQTLISRQGLVYIINKDIMLEKEEDGVWRVIEETIHRWNQKQYQPAATDHD